MNMPEILNFEEFVSKRNEARAVLKNYVIDCYTKKVKENILKKIQVFHKDSLK